jgi:hypothetical protein
MDRIPPSVTAFFPNSKPVWPKSSSPKPLTSINQLAIVVSNIEKAIEYFGAAFGWGPFYVVEAGCRVPYKGEMSEINLRLAFTMVGSLEVELLQPLSGSSPHMEHLNRHGEGLLHIRFATEDMEGTLAHLATLDIRPTLSYTNEDELLNVYVDSDKAFGVRAELIHTDDVLSRMNIGPTYLRESLAEKSDMV